MTGRALLLIVSLFLLAPPATAQLSDIGSLGSNARASVLGYADRSLYAEIFRLQENGRWEEADKQIAQLSDHLLMGHVLAQRYLHPTDYRSRFDELATWLEAYADHPQAQRIYRLALKRKPNDRVKIHKPIEKPDSLSEPLPPPPAYRSALRLSHTQYKLKIRTQRKIRRYLARTYLTKTERVLQDKKLERVFDRYEFDLAYADLAAGWFYYGDSEKALRLASEVTERSGKEIPVAHWTAGLAAWKLGQERHAAEHFVRLAESEASDWNKAAGAYWAARAFFKMINLAEAERWLRRASQFPETFYGLLALRRLGHQPPLSFQNRSIGVGSTALLVAYPEGRRALALLEIGAHGAAEEELLWFNEWQDTGVPYQLAVLADRAQLSQLGFRIVIKLRAAGVQPSPGVSTEAISYPVIPWQPNSGLKVDRGLLLAFVRQESSFDPSAKSHDGARGLMQLMPRTASALARASGIALKNRDALYDPGLNLELGQSYLLWLLKSPRVGNDLLRLAVAYNAGPGNLAVWDRHMGPQDDPLLFLETLPSRETRLFVERVMTNLWIYRLRFAQAAPSLDALANGQWPRYQPQDSGAPQLVTTAPDDAG